MAPGLVTMALVQRITRRNIILYNIIETAARRYSDVGPKSLGKKLLNKGVPKQQEFDLPVETDAQVLVNYVCGTKLYEESGEVVKIKPDSQYPDWLWTLHTGKPKEVHELDPNTMEYWKRVRKLGIKTHYKLMSLIQSTRDYK